MLTDRRTENIDRDALGLIFQRLQDKVLKRTEDKKHAQDRDQRRAVDALRSKIKHLEPPVRLSDSWDDVQPRVEKTNEYKVLDSDDLRKSAFEKVKKRLKEKEEDADKDRERPRARRPDERERDHRNGHKETRQGRLSRSPELDAYDADRRKAMAARERQYRKNTSMGLTPPPESLRERDRDRDRDRRPRDDRHGRLDRDRSPPTRQASGYERDRRPPDDERDRLYRMRADPRGSRDELNYGEETKSLAGSERRRRRGTNSDGESDTSGRKSSKRHRKERSRERERESKRSKTPEIKKETLTVPEAEPAGVHSGSEEGEIEED